MNLRCCIVTACAPLTSWTGRDGPGREENVMVMILDDYDGLVAKSRGCTQPCSDWHFLFSFFDSF